MSAKFDAFIADLKALCEKHQVSINASGYESLEVWDDDMGEHIDGPVQDWTDPASKCPRY